MVHCEDVLCLRFLLMTRHDLIAITKARGREVPRCSRASTAVGTAGVSQRCPRTIYRSIAQTGGQVLDIIPDSTLSQHSFMHETGEAGKQ